MISRKDAELIEKTLNHVKSIENAAGLPHYNLEQSQEYKVNIRVDNSVPHALFKPDPKLEGGYICSEQTFKAMKKNIFAMDEEMVDLEDLIDCDSCKTSIDRQFWNFCPHCGSGIKN
ncbi:MAG: hypothetical protein KC478_15175 [Bacteriovoracaceae bacterium]|nr:hypothetical protein [Bacteriovoracaceae bacterium]